MGNRKKKGKKKALKHRFAEPAPAALSPTEPVVLFEPPRVDKMSEVVFDFIKPYENHWGTEEQLRKVLAVALVAWNAAIAPPRKRRNWCGT